MKAFYKRFWQQTQGQDLVEYALAAGLVAVAAVAAMPALSTTVSTVFSQNRLDHGEFLGISERPEYVREACDRAFSASASRSSISTINIASTPTRPSKNGGRRGGTGARRNRWGCRRPPRHPAPRLRGAPHCGPGRRRQTVNLAHGLQMVSSVAKGASLYVNLAAIGATGAVLAEYSKAGLTTTEETTCHKTGVGLRWWAPPC